MKKSIKLKKETQKIFMPNMLVKPYWPDYLIAYLFLTLGLENDKDNPLRICMYERDMLLGNATFYITAAMMEERSVDIIVC